MRLKRVKFYRGPKTELDNIPNDDRHVLCNTETGEISFEYDGKRLSQFVAVKAVVLPAKNGNTETISYPDGLNKNNCICIGVFCNNNYDEDEDTFEWSGCVLKRNAIEVTLGCDAGYYGKAIEVYIVLMRV